MLLLPLIEAKRDGHALSTSQLQEFVTACARDQIPDYQLAAFLMAILFRGLTVEETRALTLAMRDSGTTLVFPKDARPLVDKHSTGGVGDKVSLPLAPLLACLGLRVPMISGRGLGITGGTLDKLDSIPGFKTSLDPQRIIEVVQRVGCVICGQTETMVPADRKLYALRDVTGTVPSIPLIVASILSKKLAENISALVLDVKYGRAAFMKERGHAKELALAMVALGNECGVKTRAVLSDMNSPLGAAVGNWLEVREAVQVLEGRGSAAVRELVLACAAHLVVLSGLSQDIESASGIARACLDSGKPRAKWDEMLTAQGADPEKAAREFAADHIAPAVLELRAQRPCFVFDCDAQAVGELVRDLGGGRLTKDSALNHAVGVDALPELGAPLEAGALLGRVHAANRVEAERALARLQTAFVLKDAPPPPRMLIAEVIG